MMSTVVRIPLGALRAHEMNANVMAAERFEKLVEHMGRTGRYPPLIVRRVAGRGGAQGGIAAQGAKPQAAGGAAGAAHGVGAAEAERAGDAVDVDAVYEVLDGHHRWRALERLGHTHAAAVVWDVGDAEALVLLATLNRLRGEDDPRRRAAIFERIAQETGAQAAELARAVPETLAQVNKLLEARRRLPEPREPRGLREMPAAVCFILTGAEREELEEALRDLGGRREAALMRLVRGGGPRF